MAEQQAPDDGSASVAAALAGGASYAARRAALKLLPATALSAYLLGKGQAVPLNSGAVELMRQIMEHHSRSLKLAAHCPAE
jgi:hypothetical protein